MAYGSDVRLVQKLLLQVADNNREVIKDARTSVPRPQALFLAFGDSRLEFELRCFIRDITRRFPVISDLNLAIDDALREHGVDIALPQLAVRITAVRQRIFQRPTAEKPCRPVVTLALSASITWRIYRPDYEHALRRLGRFVGSTNRQQPAHGAR